MARWVLPVPVPPTSTTLRCGAEQVADNALRLMLALDGSRRDLVEGGLHSVKLELTHQIEELSKFHHMVLLRLS
jgi:hypothetical protein